MKLPEKEWFSLEEVADRWRTDVERIKHYLLTGKLMPCLRQCRKLLQIENYHDMQWEWSWQAEASFCDLAKCKIRLSQAGNEAVHWSGENQVSEEDVLISLCEVQRFEKACEPNTRVLLPTGYLEDKRLRKQQIDALPCLSVRSVSTLTGSQPEATEQPAALSIVSVPVKSPAVQVAPIDDGGEQENARSASELLIPFTHSGLMIPDKDKIKGHYTQESERLIDLGCSKQDIAKTLKDCVGVTLEMIADILLNNGVAVDRPTSESRARALIDLGRVFGERKNRKNRTANV